MKKLLIASIVFVVVLSMAISVRCEYIIFPPCNGLVDTYYISDMNGIINPIKAQPDGSAFVDMNNVHPGIYTVGIRACKGAVCGNGFTATVEKSFVVEDIHDTKVNIPRKSFPR